MIALSHHKEFVASLPPRTHCVNRLGDRLHMRDREDAAGGYALIEPNSPLVWKWMLFDLDHADSYFQIEERGAPPPTFIALNRSNGHGHAGYRLAAPVTAFGKSSRDAMRFFEDVERGLCHKLGADRSYSGYLVKNPLSPRWETDWQSVAPYDLARLNDCLDKSDKRRTPKAEESAIGRNVGLFDALREEAYKECLALKKAGKSRDEFALMLRKVADATNACFQIRLSNAEINGIVRSVAKWTWATFTPAKFSRIQRVRVLKRWAKVETLTASQPWKADGVSRSTWYQRRALNGALS